MNPVWWQRLESAAIAALVVVATIHLGFGWWWLLVVFLAFDLSMVGYARNTSIGAFVYNAVHHYTGPAAMAIAFLATDQRAFAFVALAWAFHVAVDRALGYGLKHDDSFAHTHLGSLRGGSEHGATPPS